MSNIIRMEDIKDKILELRGQHVILDRDVAEIYGVETKRVNEAVKNNPDKFPTGYLFLLSMDEKNEVVENFDRLSTLKFSTVVPTAFTERGLYMLATILKSQQATQATLCIIDTFAQLRELSRTMQAVTAASDETQKKNLMQRSGELLAELMGSGLETDEIESEIELNLAFVKVKHKITKKKK